MTIIVDEALLSECEEKARKATPSGENVRSPVLAAAFASFSARMDPPTTLALISAHRSALARIAELEAALSLAVTAGKARIRVEQNNAQEIRELAIIDSEEAAKEARRAALEEAALALESHDPQFADFVRSLKDKEPGQ